MLGLPPRNMPDGDVDVKLESAFELQSVFKSGEAWPNLRPRIKIVGDMKSTKAEKGLQVVTEESKDSGGTS